MTLLALMFLGWLAYDLPDVSRLNEIRAAQEDLSKTFGEAGQSFYAQSQNAQSAGPEAGAAPGAQPAGSAGEKKEDVVEADYEIVDDKKA